MSTHSSIFAWWDTVHGVAKSQTRLSNYHTHTHTQYELLLSDLEDKRFGGWTVNLKTWGMVLEETTLDKEVDLWGKD